MAGSGLVAGIACLAAAVAAAAAAALLGKPCDDSVAVMDRTLGRVAAGMLCSLQPAQAVSAAGTLHILQAGQAAAGTWRSRLQQEQTDVGRRHSLQRVQQIAVGACIAGRRVLNASADQKTGEKNE